MDSIVRNRKKYEAFIVCLLMLLYSYYLVNFRVFRFKGDSILRAVFLTGCVCLLLRYRDFRVKKPIGIILCFALGAAPSVAVSVNRSLSIQYYLSEIVILLCIQYIVEYAVEMQRDVMIFEGLKWISIFCTVVSAFRHVRGLDYVDMGRAEGITTNANTLGVYCYVALITMLFFAYHSTHWRKWFYYFLAVLNVWLIWESGSRLALIVMLIYGFVFFVLVTKQTKYKLFWVYIAIVAIVLVVLKFDTIKALVLSKLVRNTQDGMGRLGLWKVGIDIWKEHKWFGCGFMCSQFLNDGIDIWSYQLPMHNSYVSLLADTGLVGVLLIGVSYISFIFKFAVNFVVELFGTGFTRFMYVFLMFGGLFLSSVTESFLFAGGATESFLLWLSFFLCVKYVRSKQVDEICLK